MNQGSKHISLESVKNEPSYVSVKHWLQDCSRLGTLAVYHAFGRDVRIERSGNEYLFRSSRLPLPREYIACAELLVASKFVSEGPKMYRPSVEDCEALSEIEIRIGLEDYAQPFPSFAVELPRPWQDGHHTTGEVFGAVQEFWPVAVVLRHEAGALLAGTLWSRGHWIVNSFTGWDREVTFEQCIDQFLPQSKEGTIGDTNSDERRLNLLCNRIALNACLMLVDRGSCKLPNKERDKIMSRPARNKQEVDQRRTEASKHPTVYAFDQEVRLRGAVGAKTEPAQPTGRHVKPHWRCAHWHTVLHGKAKAERKRMLYPHVLVNAAEFAGQQQNTSTTYS